MRIGVPKEIKTQEFRVGMTPAGVAITACDVTPACPSLQHEADCLGRAADCTSVYIGLNCTNSSGQSCMSGSTGCTCTDFQFQSCRARSSEMSVMTTETTGGRLVDVLAQ